MKRTTRSLLLACSAAAATAAAAGHGLSGAAFQSSAQGLRVTLDAGTLDLTSTRDGQVVVGASGMRPGEERQGLVTIANAGDVAGALSFDAEGPPGDVPASPPLSAVVKLRVEQCTSALLSCPGAATVVSERTLASAAGDPVQALGALAPAAQRHYRLTLLWDAAENSPAYQAAATSITAAFTAEAGS